MSGGKLVMVGLSHHAAPLEIRERVAVDEAAWRAVAPAAFGSILLSTCNRVEIYAWADDRGASTAQALRRALARAAGLDWRQLRLYVNSRIGREALAAPGARRQRARFAGRRRGADSRPGARRRCAPRKPAVRCRRRCAASSSAWASQRDACEATPVSARRRRSLLLASAWRCARARRRARDAARGGAGRGRHGSRSDRGAHRPRGAREGAQSHAGARRARLGSTRPAHVSIDSLDALPDALRGAALVVGATASRSLCSIDATVERDRPLRRTAGACSISPCRATSTRSVRETAGRDADRPRRPRARMPGRRRHPPRRASSAPRRWRSRRPTGWPSGCTSARSARRSPSCGRMPRRSARTSCAARRRGCAI